MEDANTFSLCSNMPLNKEREQVKKKIQQWLLEEGFKIQTVANKNTLFNFLAEDRSGIKINILQPLDKKDVTIIGAMASLPPEQRSKFAKMEKKKRTSFLWELRFKLLQTGLGFTNVVESLEPVRITKIIYYDGLTKNRFFDNFYRVRNGLLLVFWMASKELGEPSPTEKVTYVT